MKRSNETSPTAGCGMSQTRATCASISTLALSFAAAAAAPGMS
jgi:hypothetical protein